MLDEDIVAVSPSSVYRVLAKAGVMQKWLKMSDSCLTSTPARMNPFASQTRSGWDGGERRLLELLLIGENT